MFSSFLTLMTHLKEGNKIVEITNFIFDILIGPPRSELNPIWKQCVRNSNIQAVFFFMICIWKISNACKMKIGWANTSNWARL